MANSSAGGHYSTGASRGPAISAARTSFEDCAEEGHVSYSTYDAGLVISESKREVPLYWFLVSAAAIIGAALTAIWG